MKKQTVATLLAVALILPMVGSTVAVPGLSGTEHPVPFEENKTDVSSSVTFDLTSSGSGDVILYGDGKKDGSEVTKSGTGESSVTFDHQQRGAEFTFHGEDTLETYTVGDEGWPYTYETQPEGTTIDGTNVSVNNDATFNNTQGLNVDGWFYSTSVSFVIGSHSAGTIYTEDKFSILGGTTTADLVDTEAGGSHLIQEGATLNGTAYLTGQLDVTHDSVINGDLYIDGDVSLNSNVEVQGTVYYTGSYSDGSGGGPADGATVGGTQQINRSEFEDARPDAPTQTVAESVENPSVDVDNDGTAEISYSGKLLDGESATVKAPNLSSGSYTFEVSSDSLTPSWDYEAVNDGRTHVANVTVNSNTYDVNQFLGTGDTVRLSTSFGKGNNTVDIPPSPQGESPLTKVGVEGEYNAWQAIYVGIGHNVSEEGNVVFDYSSPPLEENRIEGMNVSAVDGTTELDIYDWTPSNNDIPAEKIVDMEASDDVNVSVSSVSSDHEYVVFQDGEERDTLNASSGEIAFTGNGSIQVYTKSNSSTYDDDGGLLPISNDDGVFSWYEETTGLPPITLVGGIVVALFGGYLWLVRASDK